MKTRINLVLCYLIITLTSSNLFSQTSSFVDFNASGKLNSQFNLYSVSLCGYKSYGERSYLGINAGYNRFDYAKYSLKQSTLNAGISFLIDISKAPGSMKFSLYQTSYLKLPMFGHYSNPINDDVIQINESSNISPALDIGFMIGILPKSLHADIHFSIENSGLSGIHEDFSGPLYSVGVRLHAIIN